MKVERDQVISKFKEFQNACAPILQVVNNQNLLKQLRTDKQFNMQHLKEHFQVTEESLDALYNYAKFQFDCGAYSNSAEYLQIYRSLSNNLDKCFSALWGKFASEILMQNWEEAIKDMNQLKDAIDSSSKVTFTIAQSIYSSFSGVYFTFEAATTARLVDSLESFRFLQSSQWAQCYHRHVLPGEVIHYCLWSNCL